MAVQLWQTSFITFLRFGIALLRHCIFLMAVLRRLEKVIRRTANESDTVLEGKEVGVICCGSCFLRNRSMTRTALQGGLRRLFIAARLHALVIHK